MRAPLAAAVLASGLAAGCDSAGLPLADVPAVAGDAIARFERFSFSNAAGQRNYKLYVPQGYTADKALPLIVDLHGCGSNADEEARWSGFNALAEARQVLVAYPEQDPNANGSRCWNWFLPEHQTREAGEPAIIAGITHEVMGRWNVDARRVHIAGISAGGAMSVIMAATHPDLYASAMAYAGCEYMGLPCLGAPSATPAETSGEMAFQQMGPRARVVPVMVIQGDADPLVPSINAEMVVQQFLAMGDWADDGANNGSISRVSAGTERNQKPGGRSSVIDRYTDASGCLLALHWLIEGSGHMWSNATPNGSPRDAALTDPLGPDVSTPSFEFLLSHALPANGRACTAS